MKTFLAMAAVGLSLAGSIGTVAAQSYGGRDYGYGERNDGYRERGGGYGERGGGYGDRSYDDRRDRGGGRGSRDRESAFDEREYVRCNPDVRQALRSGQLTSALAHYQKFGRREGRRLSC